MQRARAILTDLAGIYVRLPDRIVHGAALFHRLPADTPVATAAKPKPGTFQEGDRVRMTVDCSDAVWRGCPGSRLSFSVGYTVLWLHDEHFLGFFC